MKRKKRFLSALLALSLVLTTLPAEALAAEPRGITEGQIQRDIADGQTQTETDELPEGLSVSEEGIQVYADMIQHDLENGAFLYFDSDSGTVTGCTPGEATEIQIPTEINGVSVVSIGDSAFWNCYVLTNITIPDGVTTIGNSTFNGCSSLTNITIPDGVTTIGNSTFRGCNSLTSITIPDSVTTIGDSAFYGCSSLTSITIPDSVTTIGDSTFYGCSSLTSITIPDSVASIGDSTFYSCSSLTSITIPDSVTTIGDSTFYGCSSLTSITIPDSVNTIGDSMFEGCSSLTNITIPDSVTSIERNAFVACGLTEITIPNSVTSIEPSAFFGCIKLTSITISDSVTIIGDSMLSGCSSLTNITIPNGVTTIGDSAFYGCSSLTDITIPDSVTSIGRNAFTSSGLTSITIPGSVASIGDSAFNGCRSLTNITILDGVTSIGNELFEGCSELTNITIPDSVTSIGDSAFWECSKLTNITIPDSVTSIGSSAFVKCIELKSITIPGGVTAIRDSTFNGCRSLTEITIPDSVTSIGSYAFVDCSSLTEIDIPDSVTSIGIAMFLRCHKLTSITIPDSVTAIGENVFTDCSSLTEIIIPSSVTSIGSSVFSGCSSLTEITIPDSVTSIGGYAFEGCSSLTEITIPASVTSIGWLALDGCPVTIYCFPGSYAETYALQERIPYKYFKEDNRTLKVVLQDERGNSLTEGFSVTWYDADGNSLGTGKTLGNADPEEAYTFEIQLDKELDTRYEQPERQTIMPEDEAVCNVRLVLKPVIAMLKLAGRVFDKNGQPIGGAAVSIAAADSNLIEAATKEDGTFSAEVPYAVVYMTVQKDGYYSGRLMLDLSGETVDFYQADDFVLSEVITVSDQVTLDITQKAASENAEQALETPVVSAKALAFALTGNDGRSITDYEVQGTALIFGSGAVSANETITVTVTDPVGIYTGSSAVVTLDGDRLGRAELTLTEKGSFLLGSLSGSEATLLVFDDGGSCIRTSKAQGGMSSGTLDAGKYRVVLLQKSSMLGGASNLDYLSTLGLKAGQDYLLRNITISDGKIIRLDDCTVPALDDSAMSYVIAENTSVTTNKSSGAALGELVLVRAAYELDSAKGVSTGDLRIALPEGVVLADSSVALVDGRQTAYTYDSAKREAKLSVAGRNSATVYLYCYAVSPGSHNVSAYLTLNNGAVQPIGSAAVRVETAKLNVVEQTGIAEGLTASGKTLPNSTVVLYDNDEEVGRTTSNGAGSWSMKFDLVQPVYSYSYHFVRAVTENDSLFEPFSTEESMITYNKDFAGSLTKITMYNTGDQGPQETVSDFTEESTIGPYYRMWPSMYPTFTFKAEFSGDASELSDVYVVTTNSVGDNTYVKTTYDETSNAWVGTYDYSSFNDAPVQIGAAYKVADDGIIPFDEEMAADLKKDLLSMDKELTDLLGPALEDIFSVENIECNGDSVKGDVIFTNPETKEQQELGSFKTTFTDIEEGTTPEQLKNKGYEPFDENNQIWANIGEPGQNSTSVYVDLMNKVSVSVNVELSAQESAVELFGQFARWGLTSVIGGAVGCALGNAVVCGALLAGVVIAAPTITLVAGAAAAVGTLIAIPVVGAALDTWEEGEKRKEEKTFRQKMDKHIRGNMEILSEAVGIVKQSIYATCPTDGSSLLSEDEQSEFSNRLISMWWIWLREFEEDSVDLVEKIGGGIAAKGFALRFLLYGGTGDYASEVAQIFADRTVEGTIKNSRIFLSHTS